MSERNEDAFVIGTMRWSFSRISSFSTCPFEWHKIYIDCADKVESSFGQFGTLMHTILEKYEKGELDIFDLSQYYEDHFNEYVTCEFPNNKYVSLYEKYYQAGLEYLNNIDLDIISQEILGVEKQVSFNIGGHEFIGFIDLLLRDKQTGDITILDHKSASIGILKSGKVAKKDRDHFDSFKKQLYLYSKPVIDEYGHVDKLKWNLFKEQKYIEIPFDKDEYEAAIQWAEDIINTIEAETEWNINNDLVKAMIDGKYPPFYCMNLCSQRYNCPDKCEYLEQLKSQTDS